MYLVKIESSAGAIVKAVKHDGLFTVIYQIGNNGPSRDIKTYKTIRGASGFIDKVSRAWNKDGRVFVRETYADVI